MLPTKLFYLHFRRHEVVSRYSNSRLVVDKDFIKFWGLGLRLGIGNWYEQQYYCDIAVSVRGECTSVIFRSLKIAFFHRNKSFDKSLLVMIIQTLTKIVNTDEKRAFKKEEMTLVCVWDGDVFARQLAWHWFVLEMLWMKLVCHWDAVQGSEVLSGRPQQVTDPKWPVCKNTQSGDCLSSGAMLHGGMQSRLTVMEK